MRNHLGLVDKMRMEHSTHNTNILILISAAHRWTDFLDRLATALMMLPEFLMMSFHSLIKGVFKIDNVILFSLFGTRLH